MSIFKINGEDVPSPVSAVFSFADLSSEESGRSTRDGSMQKDIISQKRTITLTWGNLTFQEASTVLQLCKNKGAAIWLTFPDIFTGNVAVRRCYTGDVSGAKYSIPNENDIRVSDMSCSFIEM